VGAINLLPLGSAPNPFGYASEAAPDMWAAQAADTRIVTPEYFSTMGVRLLSGRLFTEQDNLTRPLSIVVDDTLAKKMWPGRDAVGQKVNMTTFHVNSPPTKEWWTVIGVVDHTRNESLTENGMVEIYRPLYQDLSFNMSLVVRHATDPVSLQKGVAAVMHRMDPSVPLYRVRTMEDDLAAAQAPMQFNLVLIGAFALLAVVLASVGLYGVIAYLVAQRTREIGVRIALGAQKNQIFGMVLNYGLRLTVLGLVIGVGAALAISRLIANQLFAVRPTDLLTFVMTSLVLGAVAILATYLPSYRAANLDPVAALRNEGQ
jgi:putative ABC transport system permease protein